MIKLIVIAIAVFVEIAHSGYDMLIRNDVLQATVEMNSALLIGFVPHTRDFSRE